MNLEEVLFIKFKNGKEKKSWITAMHGNEKVRSCIQAPSLVSYRRRHWQASPRSRLLPPAAASCRRGSRRPHHHRRRRRRRRRVRIVVVAIVSASVSELVASSRRRRRHQPSSSPSLLSPWMEVMGPLVQRAHRSGSRIRPIRPNPPSGI